MATGTIISDAGKLQIRRCGVALFTTDRLMDPRQRKPIFLVQGGYIVHQPVRWRMASGTVCSDGLLVHIIVAGYTI